MGKIPDGRYRKDCREEGQRRLLLKSTLETWVGAAKTGTLGNIGMDRRPLTEVEIELAKTRKKLTLARMERTS